MTNDPTKKDRPGVVEKYTSATHATNLVVSPDRAGPADSLMAAAWSQSRLGSALLRLHSEADATSEPRRLPETTMEVLAREIARERVKVERRDNPKAKEKVTEADWDEARRQAGEWYLNEHALRLQRLKTLPEVREQVALYAFASSIPEPLGAAANAIHWWLNNQCHVCHGQRWQLIPGTPKLSTRVCDACNGSGVRPMPDGVQTKLLLTYINDCVNRARAGIARRLQHSVPRAAKP